MTYRIGGKGGRGHRGVHAVLTLATLVAACQSEDELGLSDDDVATASLPVSYVNNVLVNPAADHYLDTTGWSVDEGDLVTVTNTKQLGAYDMTTIYPRSNPRMFVEDWQGCQPSMTQRVDVTGRSTVSTEVYVQKGENDTCGMRLKFFSDGENRLATYEGPESVRTTATGRMATWNSNSRLTQLNRPVPSGARWAEVELYGICECWTNKSGCCVFDDAALALDPPDLTVAGISGPAKVATNQQVKVDVSLAKSGSPAIAFGVNLYLSTDTIINSQDILVGSVGVSNMNYSTQTVTIAAAIPSTTGTYYWGAIVDPTDVVGEKNLDNLNNSALGSQVSVVPPPDLTVEYLAPGGNYYTRIGYGVWACFRVTNNGQIDAGSFHVAGYLSSDRTITSADRYSGGALIPSLAAGLSQDVCFSTSARAGLSYWGAIVDDTNLVVEANETNNTVASPYWFYAM